MLSMSTVRKHFWHVVRRWCGAASWPRKYGFSGCIPALISSVEGSYWVGTSDADGSRLWSCCSKNSRKVRRISSVVIAT